MKNISSQGRRAAVRKKIKLFVTSDIFSLLLSGSKNV